MQFNMFEAGAAKTPPQKPLNPSIGYPSNGDLSHGEAPTQLGAYWVYQLSEEFTALLKDNGIEPSPDDLHQLSTFFKNYKSAMAEIKEVAVEAGSGAKTVLADMRQTQKEMIDLKAGTAEDLKQTRLNLASTRDALSEVNAVLDDARSYTQKFNQFQGDLDSSKGQIQSLLTQNSSLEGEIKKDLSEIAKKQSAIHDMETHVASVKGEVDSINSTLTQKAADVAKILTSVNETEKQMQSQLKQAGAAVESVQSIKRDVSTLKDDVASSVETVRSLGKQAADTVDFGLANVKSVADGVSRDKEEAKSYRNQAQTAATNAQASAEQAKLVDWKDVRNKPGSYVPENHKHAIDDVNGLGDAISSLTEKVNGVGEFIDKNKPKIYVVEFWEGQSMWYKKYSNGWVEQGGTLLKGDSRSVTITYPVSFKSTEYTLLGVPISEHNDFEYPRYMFVNTKTTTGFSGVARTYKSFEWIACGYC